MFILQSYESGFQTIPLRASRRQANLDHPLGWPLADARFLSCTGQGMLNKFGHFRWPRNTATQAMTAHSGGHLTEEER